jgi:hypothetical protein
MIRLAGAPEYNLRTTTSQSLAQYYTKLKRDIKILKAIEKEIEAKIRLGLHPETFDLEAPTPKFYVPAPVWQAHVGKDWIEANQKPMNQQMIIKIK